MGSETKGRIDRLVDVSELTDILNRIYGVCKVSLGDMTNFRNLNFGICGVSLGDMIANSDYEYGFINIEFSADSISKEHRRGLFCFKDVKNGFTSLSIGCDVEGIGIMTYVLSFLGGKLLMNDCDSRMSWIDIKSEEMNDENNVENVV